MPAIVFYMNIYVGNLDFKVNENDLKEIFEEYATVSDSKIITDRYSGQSKGFGFVTIDNASDANKAISELNGATLENRELVVNEARPRKEF
ncbi:RNA recognition motif domain-containing protein [Maribellus luteus]|nr:RNA-binding protein [Maribellus luteus]